MILVTFLINANICYMAYLYRLLSLHLIINLIILLLTLCQIHYMRYRSNIAEKET